MHPCAVAGRQIRPPDQDTQLERTTPSKPRPLDEWSSVANEVIGTETRSCTGRSIPSSNHRGRPPQQAVADPHLRRRRARREPRTQCAQPRCALPRRGYRRCVRRAVQQGSVLSNKWLDAYSVHAGGSKSSRMGSATTGPSSRRVDGCRHHIRVRVPVSDTCRAAVCKHWIRAGDAEAAEFDKQPGARDAFATLSAAVMRNPRSRPCERG